MREDRREHRGHAALAHLVRARARARVGVGVRVRVRVRGCV